MYLFHRLTDMLFFQLIRTAKTTAIRLVPILFNGATVTSADVGPETSVHKVGHISW